MIAGKIPFCLGGCPRALTDKKLRLINELASYIHCFLVGHVYHGNSQQAMYVVSKMLRRAQIANNTLIFSFPEGITRQFQLQETLHMPFEERGAIDIYCNDLLPRASLSCDIGINLDNIDIKEGQYAFNRLQQLVLKSEKHVERIRIHPNRIKSGFKVAIGFYNKKSHPRIVFDAEDMTDAVYKIQEALLF